MRQLSSTIFRHGGACDLDPDDCPFAGRWGQPVDQRFFATGEADGSARQTCMTTDEFGVRHLSGGQATGPVQPRRCYCASVRQNGSLLADAMFDEPLSQGTDQPLSARREFRTTAVRPLRSGCPR